mgnify:CR=1 FL=1
MEDTIRLHLSKHSTASSDFPFSAYPTINEVWYFIARLIMFCIHWRVETHFFFESSTIQRMELLVLSTLGWRMSSITPFSYIHLFMPMLHPFKFNTKNTLSSRINDLIFESIQGNPNPSHFISLSLFCVQMHVYAVLHTNVHT